MSIFASSIFSKIFIAVTRMVGCQFVEKTINARRKNPVKTIVNKSSIQDETVNILSENTDYLTLVFEASDDST